MFEEVLLGGDHDRSLVLQTGQGNAITNVIEREPDDRHRDKYDRLRKKHGTNWSNRKPATGTYNCYGMIFASRRTAILDDRQVPDILKDDGFRPIAEGEAVVGDVVFYKDDAVGLLHAARITRRDSQIRTAIFALSKWDSTSGEDEHQVRRHCWTDLGLNVELEFWTERP